MEQMTEAGSMTAIKEAAADVFWAAMRLVDEIVHATFGHVDSGGFSEVEFCFCQFAHLRDPGWLVNRRK